MALPDSPEFEADHMERGKQRFPCYRMYASSGQDAQKILVENGLAQISSEGSSSPEMHSTVLGREGEYRWRIGWAEFRGR